MTVTLPVDATPSTSALLLCPWAVGDLDSLVQGYRGRALRRWTSLPVENGEDAWS